MKKKDSKVKAFFVKYRKTVIFICVAILLLVLVMPLLIDGAYILGERWLIIRTKWDAADALSFYGSTLSLLGTVVLGAISIYQNRNAHKLNLQMQQLERAKFTSMISLSELKVRRVHNKRDHKLKEIAIEITEIVDFLGEKATGECYIIEMLLRNSSSYPVVQFTASVSVRNQDGFFTNARYPIVCQGLSIPEHGATGVRFIIPCQQVDEAKNHDLQLGLEFVNIFNFSTSATVFIENVPKTITAIACKYNYSLKIHPELNTRYPS